MLFIYLYFIVSETYESPGKYSFTLTAGQYTIYCYGAQGGNRCDGGKNYSGTAGNGACTKGTMIITGKGTKFYAFVGGQGESCNNPSLGGFNGGGDSGRDTVHTVYPSDARPGAGGGSTDLRINDDSIMSRIMVAGGGAGAAWDCKGSYGGNTKIICPNDKNSVFREEEGGNIDGRGGNGCDNDLSPGGGGGGGYRGGRGGEYNTVAGHSFYAVGCGGSSYISSDESTIKFQNPQVWVDNHTGNGRLDIITDVLCSANCSACTSEKDCTECFEGFLIDGQCKEDCPDGYGKIDHKCVVCEEGCKECTLSTSNCTSCKENYHLHGNSCVQQCPPGTTTKSNKCIDCELPCKTCSSSPSECLSCANGYALYNGKCILTCPDGTVNVNSICETCKESSHCETCVGNQENCTSCNDGFFLLKNACITDCPPKMFGMMKMCVECKSPCDTCSSENDCLSCIDNFYLYNDMCYPVCPDGTSISGNICI